MKKLNKKPSNLRRLIGNFNHEDSVSLRTMFQKATVRKELRDNKEDSIELVTEILQANKMTIVDAINTFKGIKFLKEVLLSHYQIKDIEKEDILSFIDEYVKDSYLFNDEKKGEVQFYYIFSNRWHEDGNQKFNTKEEALEAFKEMIFLDGFRNEEHKAEYLKENPMLDVGMNNIMLGYQYKQEDSKWNLPTDILFSTFTELENIKLARVLDKKGRLSFNFKNHFIHIEAGISNPGWNGDIYKNKEDYKNDKEPIDGGLCTLEDEENYIDGDFPREIEAILFFKDLVK